MAGARTNPHGKQNGTGTRTDTSLRRSVAARRDAARIVLAIRFDPRQGSRIDPVRSYHPLIASDEKVNFKRQVDGQVCKVYRGAMKRTVPSAATRQTVAKGRLPFEGGSAAFRDLLSKSPALESKAEKGQPEYRARLKQIEAQLSGADGVRNYLNTLEKAGSNRTVILHILAIEMKERRWARFLRNHRRNLKNLAGTVRRVAVAIESAYASEDTYADLLDVFLQIERAGPIEPASERIPLQLLEGMRGCARDLEEKAKSLGERMKRRIPPVNRAPVTVLLMYVQGTTGNARQHLGTLSEMLDAAYHECGIKKSLTTDALEKKLVRYALPQMNLQ